jgi:hypothetical protein
VDFDRRASGSRCGSIRFVIGWCAENAGGRVEDKSEKQLRGHGGALFRAKKEWKQGSYRGAGSQVVRSSAKFADLRE